MKKKILITTIILLLIVGIAVAVVLVGKKDKKTGEKPEETTTEEVTTEAPSEEQTEDKTTEAEPDEEETTEEEENPVEKETQAPAEGLEIGAVMTPEILYGDKLDELMYEYQMEQRDYKAHIEYMKEISSDISTKYRSEYVKDLENLTFIGTYYVDENSEKYLADKTQEELEAYINGAAEVAQKFAAVYYTNDSNGPVYGYPSWDFAKYVYDRRVKVDHIKDFETLFIMGMKLERVDLKISRDGTVQAFAEFMGYGVDCDMDNENHDVMFLTSMKLVYDGNAWYVWDTAESYGNKHGLITAFVSTSVDGVPQMIADVEETESIALHYVIGDEKMDHSNIDRK